VGHDARLTTIRCWTQNGHASARCGVREGQDHLQSCATLLLLQFTAEDKKNMTFFTDLRAAFEAGLRDDKCVMVPPQQGLALIAVVKANATLLRSIIYRLNGCIDACSLAIIDDCDAALAELEAANPTR